MTSKVLWVWGGVGLLGVGIVLALLVGISSPESAEENRIKAERGLQGGPAPWPVETENLRDRLEGLNFPVMTSEAFDYHVHAHLDLGLDDQKVLVPANVGINTQAGYMSALHTHDASGIIHIESPERRAFTLGQFFTVWGVKHTVASLGGYENTESKTLRLYVNGQLQNGDWRNYEFEDHDQIFIFYGSVDASPEVPGSFDFPEGL